MQNNFPEYAPGKIITFLLLTFGITALFDIPSVLLEVSGPAAKLFNTAAMWCPAIAVLLTKCIYKENIRLLHWQWPKARYILWAFVVPVLYTLIGYLVIWNAGWGSFFDANFVSGITSGYGLEGQSQAVIIAVFILMTGIFGMFAMCANTLGEEIGWRGYLTPALYHRFGYVKTSLIVGVIWAVWHYTVLIFGDYNNGTPFWYGLVCFTILVIASTFIITWFTIKSRSLWPAVIMHASHNLYIQQIFTPLTFPNEDTPWFIGEFGLVLPAVTLVFSAWFIANRRKLDNVTINVL